MKKRIWTRSNRPWNSTGKGWNASWICSVKFSGSHSGAGAWALDRSKQWNCVDGGQRFEQSMDQMLVGDWCYHRLKAFFLFQRKKERKKERKAIGQEYQVPAPISAICAPSLGITTSGWIRYPRCSFVKKCWRSSLENFRYQNTNTSHLVESSTAQKP